MPSILAFSCDLVPETIEADHLKPGNVIDFAQARTVRADPQAYGRRLGRIWRPQVSVRDITSIRALMREPAGRAAAVEATSELILAHLTCGVGGVPALPDDATGEDLYLILEGVMLALVEPAPVGASA